MEVSRKGSAGISSAAAPESTGDTVTVAAFDPAVFDALSAGNPSSSGRELSDLEATQEIPVTFRPAPPVAVRSVSTAPPPRPQTVAASPVASPNPKKGVVSGYLILALAAVLTVWVCVTLRQ